MVNSTDVLIIQTADIRRIFSEVFYGSEIFDKGTVLENNYFKEALASMVSQTAYGDAVRHMHDKGLNPEEIKKNLDYPVTLDKIEQVIKEYELKKESPNSEYEYVQKTDEYGRRSFLRRKK